MRREYPRMCAGKPVVGAVDGAGSAIVLWVGRVGRVARRRGLGVLVAATVLGASLATAPAAQAAADPTASKPAPSVVEGFAPYLPQVSCDPAVKPGTGALRNMLLATYGGRDLGASRSCDIGARSEHKEGRAWDWGLDASVPAERALAHQFQSWLVAPGPNGVPAYNARRLGVMYVIYDGRIWSSYRSAEGWRSYSGGESHSGHLHISLAWTGAMKRTSWWTGHAAAVDFGPCAAVEGATAPSWSGPRGTPCPAPGSSLSLTGSPLLQRDSDGPYVLQLQRLLSVTPATGFFGPITEAAVAALQQRAGLPVSRTTTVATWAAARGRAGTPAPSPPATEPVVSGRALPSRMAYTVRPGDSLSRIAKRWRSTVPAIRSASHLKGDAIRAGQLISVPVRSGITKFTWTSLRKGDRGVVVRSLQAALGMRRAYRTGLFGDITRGRVNAFKSKRGWPADGVAGPGVWRALGG